MKCLTFLQGGRKCCFGEGNLFISVSSFFSVSHVCVSPPHSGAPPPTPPSSSSSSSYCARLQPTHLPSKRRRGLASVWSARGGSAYTQCLPSWANSCVAAVWAKPGALIVTNAPSREQVRPPATSNINQTRPETLLFHLYGENIVPSFTLASQMCICSRLNTPHRALVINSAQWANVLHVASQNGENGVLTVHCGAWSKKHNQQ